MLKIILVVILIYVVFQTLWTWRYFAIGKKLSQVSFARKIALGDKSKPIFKLFIAGDSVGAGVGSSSFEKSVAGLLAENFAKDHFVQFENISVSGDKVSDVLAGLTPTEKQDLIVLIVSSNNLFHLTSLSEFRKEAVELFKKFSPLGDKVILIGPGKIADSSAIPLIAKPVYLVQGPKYAEILKNEAKNYTNIVYVNPLEHKVEISKYGNTFATDNFHPNDSGHKYWFDLISSGF